MSSYAELHGLDPELREKFGHILARLGDEQIGEEVAVAVDDSESGGLLSGSHGRGVMESGRPGDLFGVTLALIFPIFSRHAPQIITES